MSSRRSPRFITWYIAPGYSMRSLRGTDAGCHRRSQVSIVRTDTRHSSVHVTVPECPRRRAHADEPPCLVITVALQPRVGAGLQQAEAATQPVIVRVTYGVIGPRAGFAGQLIPQRPGK